MKTILKKFREIYKRRELKDFKKTDAPKTWEVTESLDGFSQSLIWIEGMLCAKGYSADEINEEGASFLKDCQSAGMPATLKAHYPGRQLDLRGTLIGLGIRDNGYKLNKRAFYLYDVYDSSLGRYLNPSERGELASLLGINCAPVVHTNYPLEQSESGYAHVFAMANGPSQILASKERIGLAFNLNDTTFPRAFEFFSTAFYEELKQLAQHS